MSKKTVPPAVEFSLFELAEAHLAVEGVSVKDLAVLLIDQAIADAAQGEHEDAGKYALLAAQLIVAYKLTFSRT